MIKALKTVVHFPINVREGEGLELSDIYITGNTFPLFILTDHTGAAITRWTGYSDARRFVNKLNLSKSDLTTIAQREAKLESAPLYNDATFVARYYTDKRDWLKAVRYFRLAKKLNKSSFDFSFSIFQNMVNAAWNDFISFEEVLPSIDSVLMAKRKNLKNYVNAVRMLGQLARKLDKTDQLEKYLKLGIDEIGDNQEAKFKTSRHNFMADFTLYVTVDTLRAINIKKASLGKGWTTDPDRFYKFAEWCLERKLALEKAEAYARKASDMAEEGQFRGKMLHTLASICDARGKPEEAVEIMQMALDNHPERDYYQERLEEFQSHIK